MATTALAPASLRSASRYAPDATAEMIRELAVSPDVGLVLDVDALERSARARIDRVMQLALETLAATGVHLVLAARGELERARHLQRVLAPPAPVLVVADGSALGLARAAFADARLLVISDSPDVIGSLPAGDRALALGRPELANAATFATADASVRALLWLFAEERQRWQRGQ